MSKLFKKMAHLFPCDHCRKEKAELQKEVVFWKDIALRYRKPNSAT